MTVAFTREIEACPFCIGGNSIAVWAIPCYLLLPAVWKRLSVKRGRTTVRPFWFLATSREW